MYLFINENTVSCTVAIWKKMKLKKENWNCMGITLASVYLSIGFFLFISLDFIYFMLGFLQSDKDHWVSEAISSISLMVATSAAQFSWNDGSMVEGS